MKRAALSIIAIVLLLSSCITGGNVFSAGGNSGSMLLDALSERPGRRTEERPIEEVLSAGQVETEDVPEVIVEEEPEPLVEDSPEAAPAVPEAEAVPVVEKEPLPLEVEEIIAEPVLPSDEEETVEEVPAEAMMDDDIPDPVEEDPVEIIEAEPAVEPLVIEEAPASAEPEVIIIEAEPELMHYGMEGWMLRLLVASVVIVILFTAATAVRSGARRPLSKLLSALLAIVFTAFPWILTATIAGLSWFWCIYLVMLLSYIIFRSGNR